MSSSSSASSSAPSQNRPPTNKQLTRSLHATLGLGGPAMSQEFPPSESGEYLRHNRSLVYPEVPDRVLRNRQVGDGPGLVTTFGNNLSNRSMSENHNSHQAARSMSENQNPHQSAYSTFQNHNPSHQSNHNHMSDIPNYESNRGTQQRHYQSDRGNYNNPNFNRQRDQYRQQGYDSHSQYSNYSEQSSNPRPYSNYNAEGQDRVSRDRTQQHKQQTQRPESRTIIPVGESRLGVRKVSAYEPGAAVPGSGPSDISRRFSPVRPQSEASSVSSPVVGTMSNPLSLTESLLRTHRSLECTRCDSHFGFVSRANPKEYFCSAKCCAGGDGILTHGISPQEQLAQEPVSVSGPTERARSEFDRGGGGDVERRGNYREAGVDRGPDRGPFGRVDNGRGGPAVRSNIDHDSGSGILDQAARKVERRNGGSFDRAAPPPSRSYGSGGGDRAPRDGGPADRSTYDRGGRGGGTFGRSDRGGRRDNAFGREQQQQERGGGGGGGGGRFGGRYGTRPSPFDANGDDDEEWGSPSACTLDVVDATITSELRAVRSEVVNKKVQQGNIGQVRQSADLVGAQPLAHPFRHPILPPSLVPTALARSAPVAQPVEQTSKQAVAQPTQPIVPQLSAVAQPTVVQPAVEPALAQPAPGAIQPNTTPVTVAAQPIPTPITVAAQPISIPVAVAAQPITTPVTVAAQPITTPVTVAAQPMTSQPLVSQAEVECHVQVPKPTDRPYYTVLSHPLDPALAPSGSKVRITFAWSMKRFLITTASDDGSRGMELQKLIQETVRDGHSLRSAPLLGEILLAPYSDGQYYRGEVVELDVTGRRARLEFFDFGDDSGWVGWTGLRSPEKAVMEYPMLGLPILLAGIDDGLVPRDVVPGFSDYFLPEWILEVAPPLVPRVSVRLWLQDQTTTLNQIVMGLL